MNAPSSNQPYVTYTEIMEQPSAWAATLDELQSRMSDIRAFVQASGAERVIFTGCGTPHYLSISAAVMCRALTGLQAEAIPSSSIWLFPQWSLQSNEKTLLVAVSRSGETTEILQAIEKFKAVISGPTVTITCFEESRIVKAVSLPIVVREAREQGIAQTRSFSSMLIATQTLITALAGQSLSQRYLELPALGRGLIAQYAQLAQQLGEDKSLERFFFLGSHLYYGLACEAMLKMKEMTLSYSEAFHFLEFRHGPMSMVNAQSLVVGLISEAGLPHEVAVLREMRERGARTLAITPVKLDADVADYQFVLPGGLTDIERAPLYLPGLHVMDYYRALLNGLNPDKPQNLTAVVNLDVEAIEEKH